MSRIVPLQVNLDILACGNAAGRIATMHCGPVIVIYQQQRVRIPFLYKDGCPEEFGASLYVWNSYRSNLIY
jgi:hypothetical protein